MKMKRQTTFWLVVQWGPLCLLATSIIVAPSSSHLVVQGFLVAPPAPPAQTELLSSTITSLCATKTKSIDDSSRCDVAIFGGGFGGLYTALSVARQNPDLDVALVEPSDSFVFLPLLYDLTVGTATESEVCPFYSDLLRDVPSVRHIKASLTRLEAASNTAVLLNRSADSNTLQFSAAVVAVGATPQAFLERVPGALDCAQPFYTATHAKQTRRLLNKLDDRLQKQQSSLTLSAAPPTTRIAIVGGGFGGVELAASVQRRLRDKEAVEVVLLSRGKPMGGTRAEPWIDAALKKLGVQVVEGCTVQSLARNSDDKNKKKITMVRMERIENEEEIVQDEWDTVLWTAGSGPAEPVASQQCDGLQLSDSGRLAIDETLRCLWEDGTADDDEGMNSQPCIWALGDCAEIVNISSEEPVLPKTAQVAMQQADTVAANLVAQLQGKKKTSKAFVYQDLGSMLTLGGTCSWNYCLYCFDPRYCIIYLLNQIR